LPCFAADRLEIAPFAADFAGARFARFIAGFFFSIFSSIMFFRLCSRKYSLETVP
jgi:hypothetical protein